MTTLPDNARVLSASATGRRRATSAMEPEFSLHFLLAVWQQWWKLLVPVSLFLLALSVGLVMFFFEPQYRAAAWLQVKGQQPYVAFPEDTGDDRDSARKYVHTQIELLRSPLILGRALAQPGMAEVPELKRRRDPIDWLAREGLEVTPKGDSELLEVAFTGADPQASAKLVDAVINAYFAIRDDTNAAQIQAVILLLENEKSRRAEGIKLLQNEIRQLQAQIVAKDPSQVGSALQTGGIVISDNPLKSVQENFGRAQVDHKIIEAQVSALEAIVDAPVSVPEILIDRQTDQRPEIQEAIAQLNQKRALLDQIAAAAAQAEEDPRYKRTQQEVEALEATLESLREASRPRIRDELVALTHLEKRQTLETLKTQLATQRLIVQNMRENYDQMVRDLSQSGGQTLDLRLKERELDQRQEVFDRISDRAAQLATELYAPRRVDPIQDARAAEVPLEQLPWKALIAACLSSLCLPFGICALWERNVRRVTSVEQLQLDLTMPVVGEIARLPLRTHPTLAATPGANYELGIFEESVDSLRTGLILSHEQASIQVLAVSSAVSGEGKSSVASQLAVSLARSSGLPTLLIDGDMRSPDLHRIFQIELQPGLADVLAGGRKITDCINRGWSEHIHILPAGKLTKSPHKLLGSDRFEAILQWARNRYRYIVIDTPPILAASEAMVMARAADGTLICAMRDVSRESHVRMTYQRLLAVGAKPVGTVLSGVPTRQYARRYGSYVYTKK